VRRAQLLVKGYELYKTLLLNLEINSKPGYKQVSTSSNQGRQIKELESQQLLNNLTIANAAKLSTWQGTCSPKN